MTSQHGYTDAYHAACNYLVSFGGYGPNPAGCRQDLAIALRAIRAAKGSERALSERMGLIFISGHFPDNPNRRVR